MVQEVPRIEDPWVSCYENLMSELKAIGMPDKYFINPNWDKIRSNIKHYITGMNSAQIIKIFKLFDQVHGERR